MKGISDMIKKTLLCIVAAVCALPAMALRSGDMAEEPLLVKWYSGKHFRFAFPDTESNRNKLSVAVFLLCRAPQAPATVMMLESLAAKYGEKLNVAVITPDNAEDLKTLLSMVPAKRISAGVDSERKLTANFMAGSPLYPMAFVTDSRGRILWNGEAVDLGEVVSNIYDGKFNAANAKKISPLLDELHVCMRNNDDRRMNKVVREILSLDPGNAAALRIRLFSLEQRNRTIEAWQLLSEELEKAPAISRLYFTGVDLILGDRFLSGQLEKLLVSFERNIKNPEHRALMAYTLCDRTSYNFTALAMAEKLLKSLDDTRLSGASAALCYAAKAAVAYRFCRLDEAIRNQEKSLAIWKTLKSPANIFSASAKLEYLRSIKK